MSTWRVYYVRHIHNTSVVSLDHYKKSSKTYILNLWHSFRVYTFGCYLCAYAAYYPELLWSMLHDVITGYTLYHWFTSRIFDDCLDEVT